MKTTTYHPNRGFTLIEILTVIAVIGIALPTFFGVVYNIVRQQTKVVALNEVKNQGDNALTIIEGLIRNNATEIYSGIAPSGTQICNTTDSTDTVSYFNDELGNWFAFTLSSDKVSSTSASTTTDLTTNKVKISELSITCNNKSSFTTPVVSLKFKAQYDTQSNLVNETATLNYQTKIKLRNFSTSQTAESDPDPAPTDPAPTDPVSSPPAIASVSINGRVNETFNVDKPTGTVNGDLLLAVIQEWYFSGSGSAVPAGFTLLQQNPGVSSNQGGTHRQSVYYKYASGEPSTYGFGSTNGGYYLVSIYRITGSVTSGNPADAMSVNVSSTNSSTTATANSISTTQNNTLLLFFVHGDDAIPGDETVPIVISTPAGMTQRHNNNPHDFQTSFLKYQQGKGTSKTQSTSGATGDITSTINPGVHWQTQLIAIKPAP